MVEPSLILFDKVMYWGKPIPRLVRKYVQWLIGHERGCETVCRCRPTAHCAKKVLTAVRLAAQVSEYCKYIVHLVIPRDEPRALPTRPL